MSLSDWLRGRRSARRPATPKAEPKRGVISDMALAQVRRGLGAGHTLVPFGAYPVSADPFTPAKPLPAASAAGAAEMALDEAFFPDVSAQSFSEGIGFFGYPLLAELAQRAEYRKMVETLAMDMTREWLRFTYTGDEDKSDRIRQIEAAFTRLQVKDKFRHAAELDGFFGRGHVYIELGGSRVGAETEKPLVLTSSKIPKGALKRLTVVDPTWTYPGGYDSTDPLSPNFYRPTHWFVMSKKVHQSRLCTMSLRPVPDMLKPAYVFGGLSMTQMAKPYVDNWLRNRQSSSDLLESFTVFWLKTDMGAVLMGGDADSINKRADLFNIFRNNRSLMLLNKGDGLSGGDPGEEMGNVSAPLNGVNDLLNSSLEQLCFVSGQPLVKLLGSTPSGLNASSDGEVRVYYDSVHAGQERIFRAPLETLLKVVQLSEFGDIDPDIGFEFNSLWQLDEVQLAAARKADADTDVGYVNAGVLDPVEVRGKLAADKEGPWSNLDVEDAPEPPEQPGEAFGEEGELPNGPSAGADRPKQAGDAAPGDVVAYYVQGLPIVVETARGAIRRGGHNGQTWQATMAADYGYVAGTWSTEGRREEMDCFVGPNRDSRKVFVIDQLDLETGQFDEHKCMLGYDDQDAAVGDYVASYDRAGRDRIMAVTPTTLSAFKRWLAKGDLYKPFSRPVGP